MSELSTKTDTLIIGFGLSAIPLIRELENDGSDYVVISAGPSIWDRLDQAGRLDFDLVSSYMSSVFSFELAESKNTVSRFPTAREFHGIIKKYQAHYRDKVVEDWVTKVENHASYSVVHTKSGATYETKKLVIATGFRRKVHQPILDYDYDSAGDKTVVITTMGDSANLIISKLVPLGARVILLNNGFFCLDKLILHEGTAYALDDLEMHNVGDVSGYLYKMVLPQGQIMAAGAPGMAKPFLGSNLFIKHPRARRNLDLTPALNLQKGSPIDATLPNGLKITKYWPIDAYKELYGDTLEDSLREGFLLNDIAYLIDNEIVELWPTEEVSLDRENRVIKWRGEVVEYDDIIEGDQERPNLPEILVERPGQPTYHYQYYYRDCFMGVIPRDMPNVFLLGYTRPMTGGLNNISEMQCLFVHKMVTNDGFHEEIVGALDERIDAYNKKLYVSGLRAGADNNVFYGQYTAAIARLTGIHPNVRDCESLEDLSIYYFFPNTVSKYRCRGPYKVEGLEEVVRAVHEAHHGYSIMKGTILNFCLMLITAVLGVSLLYAQLAWLPLSIFLLLVVGVVLGPVLTLTNTNSTRIIGPSNALMIAGLVSTAIFRHPLVALGSLGLNFLLVYVARKKRWSRPFFNDLRFKEKPEFAVFYDHYCEVYRRIFGPESEAEAEAEMEAEAG